MAVYFEPESDKIPVVAAAAGGGGGGQAGGESARHDIGRGIDLNASEFSAEKLRQMVKSPGLGQVPHFTPATGWRSTSSSGRSRRWPRSSWGCAGATPA